MSKKINLNIREKIRSGEIDTAKAGQLLSVHYYDPKNSLLSDSDERALRETAKDVKLFNAYMGGGRELKDVEIMTIAMARETELANQRLAWIGAELKYTTEAIYTPPRVVAVTEDKYEAIGKEKREKRLKRTYTLVTLYRVLAESFIKYPETKEDKETLAKLTEDANPENKDDGYIYGLDFIAPDERGYSNAIEIYRGWIPHHSSPQKLEALSQIADDLPEAHAHIMTKLEALYKAKKLSIDPNSIPLDNYNDTALSGAELETIATDNKYLSELLDTPEPNLLDNYRDEDETDRQADNRYIFEKYQQTYAIIKYPERHKLKDGTLEYDPYLDRPVAYGYRVGGNPEGMGAKLPLETIKSNRKTVRDNLYIIYVLTQWRLKAGELLGVHKLDNFKALTNNLDPTDILTSYELYRSLLLDQILRESYILPEYRDYTDEIIKLYAPLLDDELLTPDYMSKTLEELREARKDPEGKLRELVTANKHVIEALKHIEDMTISTISDSFYSVRDTLKPYIDGVTKNDQE